LAAKRRARSKTAKLGKRHAAFQRIGAADTDRSRLLLRRRPPWRFVVTETPILASRHLAGDRLI
jgi:hypothetical protein